MKYLPYFLLAISMIPLVVQFTLIRRSRRIEGNDMPAVDGVIDETLRNHKSVILYFFSSKCMACQDMTPIINRLAARHTNILKLSANENGDLARSVGIVATPSAVLVQNRKIVKVVTGFVSEKKLEALLN